MAQYEAVHPLGVYVCGLGSRETGGIFTVTDGKAARLRLDENPNLKRIDPRPVRSSKAKVTDESQER